MWLLLIGFQRNLSLGVMNTAPGNFDLSLENFYWSASNLYRPLIATAVATRDGCLSVSPRARDLLATHIPGVHKPIFPFVQIRQESNFLERFWNCRLTHVAFLLL